MKKKYTRRGNNILFFTTMYNPTISKTDPMFYTWHRTIISMWQKDDITVIFCISVVCKNFFIHFSENIIMMSDALLSSDNGPHYYNTAVLTYLNEVNSVLT